MKIIRSISVFLLLLLFTSNVNAQEITVFPGFWGSEYYQDDKEINKKELEALFAKNEEVLAYWKKSKRQELAASIALTAEMGFTVWWILELINDDPNLTKRDKVKNALGPALGVVGTGIIGTILIHASSKSKKKTILTYNKQFDEKTAFRLRPVSNQNGVGLVLQF
jgi:hypothetical protein